MYRQPLRRELTFGEIFRTLLKIFGALLLIGLVGLCCTSGVMLLILGGSVTALLAWFVGIWNSIVQYNNLKPNLPATIPLQTTPITYQQPNSILTELPTYMLPTSTLTIYDTPINTPIHIHCPGAPSCLPLPKPTTTLTPTIIFAPPNLTTDPNAPNLPATPTSLPFSNYTGEYLIWTPTNMPLYGFTIDLPLGWYLSEERGAPGDYCGLGHDIANYIVAPIAGGQIFIHLLCEGGDGESYGCPPDYALLDKERGIVRVKIRNNEYEYLHYSINNNIAQCRDGWKITEKITMIADYTQFMGAIDFPLVDRIVLSVRNK